MKNALFQRDLNPLLLGWQKLAGQKKTQSNYIDRCTTEVFGVTRESAELSKGQQIIAMAYKPHVIVCGLTYAKRRFEIF
jgi:hypothetical protein